MDAQRQKQQVDDNYDAFMQMLPGILGDHRHQLALMRDGQIAGYFDTPTSVLKAADTMFPDQIYSIQDVTDEPLHLGYWSDVP